MIKLETSGRHIHLSRKDIDVLFGEGYNLTNKKNLSQPGQFACEERVEIIGEKNSAIVSVLGPERNMTQVEVSLTDARNLGLVAPIRESGDLKDAGSCKIKGPKGEIALEHCVICAKRHIHMTEDDAKNYNVANGEIVKVAVDSPERKIIFDDVVIRVSNSYSLAMHIDTDESNAAYDAKTASIIKM